MRSVPFNLQKVLTAGCTVRTGVVIHKYKSISNCITKIPYMKYQNLFAIILISKCPSFQYHDHEVYTAISHDPSTHRYSRSVMVNINDIFGVKGSAGFMPDALAPRIRREIKSALVREETIAPFLVSPVCVFTVSLISIACSCWANEIHFTGFRAYKTTSFRPLDTVCPEIVFPVFV